MKIVLWLVITINTNSLAHAAEIRMLEKYNVGGYIGIGPTKPYQLKAHKNPRPLPYANDEEFASRGNRLTAGFAKAYMEKFPATTGMLLIDRGKIVFEAYQGQGDPTREFFSMSIAKSMTSLAVGKAVCQGALKSLDIKAGDLIPEIKANRYGQSSVRQLLMMSSGAYLSVRAGQPIFTGGLGRRHKTGKPYKGLAWPMRLGQISIGDILWGQGWEKTENKNHAEPGQVFVYKAGDTLALGQIIEKITGETLAGYFDKHIWQAVRGEASGHWETDIEGSTIAQSGFQVRLRDWGRIAVWLLEQVKQPGCFGDYLRQATTTQIKTSGIGGTAKTPFKGYGYQWWTDHRNAPGFWGRGYAGQELAINPKTKKVLIKFGYRIYSGVTSGTSDLYRNWHKSN